MTRRIHVSARQHIDSSTIALHQLRKLGPTADITAEISVSMRRYQRTASDSAPAAYSARSREPGSVPGLPSLRDPAPGVGSRAALPPVAVA